MLQRSREQRGDSWLVAAAPKKTARARLICFAHAGGGPDTFHKWSLAAPSALEIVCVQLPGRGARSLDAHPSSLEEITTALCPLLESLGEEPCALFGHSFGALVAFESARALQRCHLTAPRALLVSGRSAPSLPPLHAPLHQLAAQELFERVAERYRGIPPEVVAEPSLQRLFVPALRADLSIDERYRYQPAPPLTMPICVLRGHDDATTPEPRMLPWRTETQASCSLHTMRGGHFFIHDVHREIIALAATLLGLPLQLDSQVALGDPT
jgi:medium-chain acyl-[acyl-carrier-protein] hydrolase